MPNVYSINSDRQRDMAFQAVASAPQGMVVTFERKLTLADPTVRGKAIELVRNLKVGWRVRITKRNRSKDQNDKLWAMLTDLSHAKPEGRKCTPDDWKCLAMHACGHDVQFMEGLDGKPFPTGFRSSKLTVRQMSDLIEWTYAYGNEQGVQWSEPAREAA